MSMYRQIRGYRDLFDRTIEIGDFVAVNPPYYKGLVQAEVIEFTPKMVKVKVSNPKVLPSRSSEVFTVYPRDVSLMGGAYNEE